LSLFLAEESMKVYQCERLFTGTEWLTNAYIQVDSDGNIVSISQTSDQSTVINLSGAVVPGMVNLHSHAFQRSIAGLSEYRGNPQDSFWSWRDIMYRFVEQFSADDFHVIASQLYIEMLKSGYTSCVEFHYTHHQADGSHYDEVAELSIQVMEAAQKVGIRQTHCPVFYAWSGFGEQPPNQGQKRFINSIQSYQAIVDAVVEKSATSETLSFGIAPHSLRAANQEQISKIIQHLDRHDDQAPIHIHISEQVKEVEDCINHYGQRPVEWLYSQFDVNQRWCLVHATHLTDGETQQIATSGAVAGLCITTEANLGDGIFPIQSYLANGGVWGIGSDSHISVSPVEELRWLEYQNRLLSKQRAVLASEQTKHIGTNLYTQALKGGAQALGQSVGAIEAGKKADWLVLDTQSPLLVGLDSKFIIDAWIFSGNQNVVKDVFVNGECVISNYQHAQQDQVEKRYRSLMRRLLSVETE
jgi:formimidoylglutamate deiminase